MVDKRRSAIGRKFAVEARLRPPMGSERAVHESYGASLELASAAGILERVARVSGFEKNAAPLPTELAALRKTHEWGIYMTSLSQASPSKQDDPAVIDEQQAAANLTRREGQVLALVQRGVSNKRIARQLGIAEGTVKTHLSKVFEKLEVHTRTEASLFARSPAVSAEQLRRVLTGELPIADLLPRQARTSYPAGAFLFRKGDVTDALYCVISGTVHLEELQIDRGPGELIGEMGLLSDDHLRIATARCESECELVKVPAKNAMQLCLQDPVLSLYLAQLIRRRLTAAE